MLAWLCWKTEHFRACFESEGTQGVTLWVTCRSLPRGMAADVHKKKSWEVPNGSLAPGDGQHAERSESPTPGLAQGTEPGMDHSSPRGEKSSSSCRLGSPQPCGKGEMSPLMTPQQHEPHPQGAVGWGEEAGPHGKCVDGCCMAHCCQGRARREPCSCTPVPMRT